MPIYEESCRNPKCDLPHNEYYSAVITEITRPCACCGSETDRLYSVPQVRVFEVFTTNNVLENGQPVTIRGEGQLHQLERDHGVKLADGPPPKTDFA